MERLVIRAGSSDPVRSSSRPARRPTASSSRASGSDHVALRDPPAPGAAPPDPRQRLPLGRAPRSPHAAARGAGAASPCRQCCCRRYRALAPRDPARTPSVRVKRDDLVITVEVTASSPHPRRRHRPYRPAQHVGLQDRLSCARERPGEEGDPIVAFDTQNLEKNLERRAPIRRGGEADRRKETELAIRPMRRPRAGEAERARQSPGSRPRSPMT